MFISNIDWVLPEEFLCDNFAFSISFSENEEITFPVRWNHILNFEKASTFKVVPRIFWHLRFLKSGNFLLGGEGTRFGWFFSKIEHNPFAYASSTIE
jgi:hypothetical protein